jgi:hypothetical protein
MTEPVEPALRQLGEWLSGGISQSGNDRDAT